MNDIEQTDVVLCEDGRTVMVYGHTANEDETHTLTFILPSGVSPADLGLMEVGGVPETSASSVP